MLTRIITAIVAIAVLFPVLYFSETIAFPIVIAVLAIIGVFEMLRCTAILKKWVLSVPVLAAGAFPLLYRLLGGEKTVQNALVYGALVLFWFMAVMTFSHGKINVQDIAVTFTTALYIVGGFTTLVALRDHAGDGKYLYLICFIGAWVVDTFAYFTGRFFGKHKLIPDVSPKKTVEGSIGGTAFCIGAMILYGYIVGNHSAGAVNPNYWVLALSGIVLSVVSQIGDLLMSAIKRLYGIKDYGKLFPGHGGVLDRFDSVLAVSLLLCVLTQYFDLFHV